MKTIQHRAGRHQWLQHRGRRKIAVACQGGGSHAAFAAGVLRGLLTANSPEDKFRYGKDFVITALTGTSGGALCAGIAWAALLRDQAPTEVPWDEEQARGQDAARHLGEFWMDLACANWGTDAGAPLSVPRDGYDWLDSLGNLGEVFLSRCLPLAESHCKMVADTASDRMLTLFRRHVPPIGKRHGARLANPVLRLGATNILQGYSKPLGAEDAGFNLHEAMLASASIPPLFGPRLYQREFFWDGLFSHNPPIDCLTNLEGAAARMFPDEIWVIQINPPVCRKVPGTMAELVDRRNELSGNLSMMSELYHIDAINQMLQNQWKRKLKSATIEDLKRYGYRPIVLRVLTLEGDFDLASKYERSSGHIERLMQQGQRRAREIIEDRRIWSCRPSGEYMAEAVNVKGQAPSFAGGCPNEGCPVHRLCNAVPLGRDSVVMGHRLAQMWDWARRAPLVPAGNGKSSTASP